MIMIYFIYYIQIYTLHIEYNAEIILQYMFGSIDVLYIWNI